MRIANLFFSACLNLRDHVFGDQLVDKAAALEPG